MDQVGDVEVGEQKRWAKGWKKVSKKGKINQNGTLCGVEGGIQRGKGE